MDSISIARLQLIYPPLATKLTAVMSQLESEGTLCRLVQGLRSWSEQDALYAQGRTTKGPNPSPEKPMGEVVTNCPGGKSYHNFGLAGDLVPSLPGNTYIPDWNSSHPLWKHMEALGASQGLDVGANWRSFPDAPHFQFTGRFPEGEPDSEVQQLFKDGGMQAVWDEVTKSTGGN